MKFSLQNFTIMLFQETSCFKDECGDYTRAIIDEMNNMKIELKEQQALIDQRERALDLHNQYFATIQDRTGKNPDKCKYQTIPIVFTYTHGCSRDRLSNH